MSSFNIRIKLITFNENHISSIIKWINTEESLMKWTGSLLNYPLDKKQLKNYIENTQRVDTDTLAYSVVNVDTQEVIGHISLMAIDKKNLSARIGRVLIGDTKHRNKGIGTVIVTEILKIAFDELKLHRVTLGVFDFNKAAIACYTKVGMKVEGVQRESRKIGDAYWSLVEMSMLESEWLEKQKLGTREDL